MNFTKGSNTRDVLPPPKMPYEVKEAGFQSARRFLLLAAAILVFT